MVASFGDHPVHGRRWFCWVLYFLHTNNGQSYLFKLKK
jgi:hypothetical protein